MIVLSVAHTKRDKGAKTVGPLGLYEWDMSTRASKACFDKLFEAQIPCALNTVGYFTRQECMGPKQRMPSVFATLAVEIHFNATAEGPAADYSETIYFPDNLRGKSAAAAISSALHSGFEQLGKHWPAHGPRADGNLFFLKGPTPSVIVEGLFGSNPEQSAFLESVDGPEIYGALVAEGLKQWWPKR